jgi:glutathione S-transferase
MKGEHKGAEYLRVHPLGVLPALVDDGKTILECGAICLHLADKVPGFIPSVGSPDRAQHYQWTLFAIGTQLFALSKIAMHTIFLPPEARVADIAKDGYASWPAVARFLESSVKDKRFLIGERISVADVMVGGSLWLAEKINVLSDYPELVKYYGRIKERPAFQTAFAD